MKEFRPRLLRITTVPVSLKLLLRGQPAFFEQKGFEVLTVSANGEEITDLKKEGIAHEVVNMTRKITPVQDLISLLQLIRLIHRFRPHIVHTHTPKAGILGMLAGWICRVPVRMHTVAGLPVMEARGLKKQLLLFIEKVTYACATAVYPNSTGLRNFILGHIKTRTPLTIIGRGSTNGIDPVFFSRTTFVKSEAEKLRRRFELEENDIVFCFVGRVVKDKGIHELITGFNRVKDKWNPETQAGRLKLLVVGPFEQQLDPLQPEDHSFLSTHPDVILAGFQKDVRPWIAASDIFVFPSYREGFPNVVMQACCLEIPCIVSDINGCNEIIQNTVTGYIVPVKNSDSLADAMFMLAANSDLRKRFSTEARQFVARNFDQAYVWNELLQEYHQLLSKHMPEYVRQDVG